jgi:hypothetical protein
MSTALTLPSGYRVLRYATEDKVMAVRHQYSIICDDVRREDNGKLMILGMYVGTIVVPQLPTIMPTLTMLLFLEDDRPGEWPWKFSISTQSAERSRTIAEVHNRANVIQPGPVVMPIKFVGVNLTEAGLYHGVLEIEREPVAVVPFNVILGQVGLAPTAR